MVDADLWYDGVMEWFLLLTAGGGGGAYALQRLRLQRADRRQAADELDSVRRLAEEDVTVLGEQLARLDADGWHDVYMLVALQLAAAQRLAGSLHASAQTMLSLVALAARSSALRKSPDFVLRWPSTCRSAPSSPGAGLP